MFKGLVSRVARAVSARPTAVQDLPGATITRVTSGRRDGYTPDQPGQATFTPPRGLGALPWLWGGQRKPEPESEQPEAAVLKDLMENIDRILAVQKQELAEQLQRADKQQMDAGTEASYLEETEPPDMTAHIEVIRQLTGYTFKDPDYVRGAIFKTGKVWKGRDVGRPIQLQLALIGDKFLDFGSLSANFGYGRDTVRPNWRWLSSNATLHYSAKLLGMPQKLAEAGHAARIQGDSVKGFGTMVEALIGAVYEDSGRDGAVTNDVTTKLLGTTMRHPDVEKFAEAHSAFVQTPPNQFYWRELVEAQTRSALARVGRLDEIDAVMEKMKIRALTVDRLERKRSVATRRLALRPTSIVARKTKIKTTKTKPQSPLAPNFHGLLSGDILRSYIDYIKEKQTRQADIRSRSGSPKVNRKRDVKIARYQAYIDKAEEHLSRGESIHRM